MRGRRGLVTGLATAGVVLISAGALVASRSGGAAPVPSPTPDASLPAPPSRAGTTSSVPQAPEPGPPPAVLAWVPGGLPAAVAAGAPTLPGVDRSVVVRTGTAWLSRSTSSAGATVDAPPSGYGIPLDVGAADPTNFGPIMAPADRRFVPALKRGQAVLGASSARLRGLGPGATLVFGSVAVRVAGIVSDESVGAHEVFVSNATADRLGVTKAWYVLVQVAHGREAPVEAGLRSLVPVGDRIQIRATGETPFLREADAVLPAIRMKERFGEFAARALPGGYLKIDPSWVAAHIVTAAVPILGQVTCNRSLFSQVRGALQEVQRDGLSGLVDRGDFGGCYSARMVNRDPTAGISHHAWGAALDVNVSANPLGATPRQDPRLVAIFRAWGFTWGGAWLVPDGMHFEYLRPPA